MTTTFTSLLDNCDYALSNTRDGTDAKWADTQLMAWAFEGMLAFPILRPMQQSLTLIAATSIIDLDPDFRDILSVEYPVDQVPPVYIPRMSRFSADFYTSDMHYDLDNDYSDGVGYVLHLSQELQVGDEIAVNYLANHDIDLTDDDTDTVTIADEHVHIIVAYVVWKAYQERLSKFMQDPTAYSQIIVQMVQSVTEAKQRYLDFLKQAQDFLAHSHITPRYQLDRFDRVY